MRKVTFRFPDEESLQQFAATITSAIVEINFSKRLLTCACGEAEIELAEKGFHATVVFVEVKLN